MFTKRITLFKLMGFEVKLDLSWLILAVLIIWSLAEGLFPTFYADLPPATYWWMGVAGCLGLFFSIVFHEFSHSLVARQHDLQMKGITLFIFGGVAEMEDEPPTAKVEFLMAIAGPISSLLLALAAFVFFRIADGLDWPIPVLGVTAYMVYMNVILAAFNLVPAFPLDGGRVLRAALWQWKKDLYRATRISSRIGGWFGIGLIVLGALSFINGNFIGGMWWFLIGLFVRQAAGMSYQRLMLRRTLEGEPVSRFMSTDPISVAPEIPVQQFVENYVYHYHHKMFPVVHGEKLEGCVTTAHLKSLAREEWAKRTVGDLLEPCTQDKVVSVDDDAVRALAKMTGSRTSRLMVTSGEKLVGILSLKDLMAFFSLKMELEPNAS